MLNATRFLNQATVTPSQSKKAAAIVQWILPAGGTARIVGSDGANVRKRTVSCTAGYLFLGGKGRGRGNQVSSQEKKRHTPQRTSRWRALSTQGQRCNRNYFFVRHMRLHSVPSGLFIVRKGDMFVLLSAIPFEGCWHYADQKLSGEQSERKSGRELVDLLPSGKETRHQIYLIDKPKQI